MPDDLTELFDLPEFVQLPSWADPQFLRSVAVVAVAVSVILLVLAARVIRRLVLRTVVVVLLATLTVGLWGQRSGLTDCAADCSYSLFGQPVKIPADLNPLCSGA